MVKGLEWWNGHHLAAISIKTTGPCLGMHEIYHIVMMDLTSDIEPREDVEILDIRIRPEFAEITDVKKMKPCEKADFTLACNYGIDSEDAKTYIEAWLNELDIPLIDELIRKPLMLLGYDMTNIVVPFLRYWLQERYDEFFHQYTRDLIQVAGYNNDWASFHGEWPQWNRFTLAMLGTRLGVPKAYNRFDPIEECTQIAKIYKTMLQRKGQIFRPWGDVVCGYENFKTEQSSYQDETPD